VLPTSLTTLIGCFFVPTSNHVYTLDVDSLIRQWSVQSGVCVKSYPLEILTETAKTNLCENFQHTHKIQAAALADDYMNLAVAFEGETMGSLI